MADFNVRVKKVLPDAILPTQGSPFSAGYDLYACDYNGNTIGGEWVLIIRPHETVKITTGLAMELPIGSFGAIFARSGIATKQGLRPANCVGVIDPDYRGEFIIPLHNDTDEAQIVRKGDRIAQLVLMDFNRMNFKIVDSLDETERNDGGFGHSGQ